MSEKTLGFYPGCTMHGSSMEYDTSTRAVCNALNIKLKDLPDWNCCGSSPAHMADQYLSAALSARNFALAERIGIEDVMTPCPSCLQNLRKCLEHMEDPEYASKIDALTLRPLKTKHTIKSLIQVIIEDIGIDAVKSLVKRPLTGMKVVPYYGCLMSRPGSLMKFDDAENPTSMDRILEALGAEVLPFPLKTDCCGASMGVPEKEAVLRLSGKILDMAAELGADCVVTACPLCQMNLDLRQGQITSKEDRKYSLPVPYFTQLMGYAFGLADADIMFKQLVVNIKPAFECMQRRATNMEKQKTEAVNVRRGDI